MIFTNEQRAGLEEAAGKTLTPTQRAVLERVALHGYYTHLSGDSMDVRHGARSFPGLVKRGYLTIAKSGVHHTAGQGYSNAFGKRWRPGASARETRYEITDKGRKALEIAS